MSSKTVVAKNAALISSGQNIMAFRELLKAWKPSDKIEVVKMLAFLSITGNADTVKKIKDACYSYLDVQCKGCLNAIDPESGIEVERRERETKVYNESEELIKLTAQMEKLKAKIKAAQEKAGVKETNTSVYYQLKK